MTYIMSKWIGTLCWAAIAFAMFWPEQKTSGLVSTRSVAAAESGPIRVEQIIAQSVPGAPIENVTKGYAIPIPDETWREMQGKSWHPSLGCSSREELVLLRIPFLDFEGRTQLGEMITARSVASDVLDAFAEIYRSGEFRIQKMQLIDRAGGNDAQSTMVNNTSAFNCRAVTGGATLSEHSYGKAIDINPVQNPFVTSTITKPLAGARFKTLSRRSSGAHIGVIREGDVVTKAFARIGWKWGGAWDTPKDYQHFSQSGK